MMEWRIALPLAIGLASPIVAGATEHGVSVAISYADLDLSQQADARRLHARVRSATRTICTQPRQGVLASPAESLCRRIAMARAQGQIDRAVKLAATRGSLVHGRFASVTAR
jgi:UrcA family protein